MAEPADVSIALTADEALVLFDLLHRWEDEDRVSAAGQVALWNLSALLDRELRETFHARYGALVTDARARLNPSD